MRLRKRVEKLVTVAREKLLLGDREAALDDMREAVRLDGNRGLVIQVILELERGLEEELPPDTGPAEAFYGSDDERKDSMPSEDRLDGLFAASDKAYDRGDQAAAMNLLKKARKLAPDSPEVAERLELLKKRIKSSNIVSIACKELEKGNHVRAVELSREAFDLLPEATGLDALLERLESLPATNGDSSREDRGPAVEVPLYITEIRTLVQNNSLEEAAARAMAAYGEHPDDPLLEAFVVKFTRLGFLKK
jgi:tetratricopeptide (TPR) repeat protein